MADVLLASIMLFGGLGFSFLCLMAAANMPTGGGPIVPFIGGLIAAACGLLYWAYIIVGWLI